MKNTINAGLCKGRHEMPVSAFIFDEIKDYQIFDFKWQDKVVSDYIVANCMPEWYVPQDTTIATGYRCDTHLNLYVTGLTALTAAVIKQCCYYGVGLSLWHYDTATGEYKEQFVFPANRHYHDR